ncbi:hypothetical protein ES708_21273 [subsurface metagenome]
MRQQLTPHDIANTVRMTRSLHKGAVVLVEGDSDARVYGRFVDEKRCRVIPAHGKSNVLTSLDIIENDSVKGVCAIVDSDFSCLDEDEITNENVMQTDTHDLETMIISSRALDTILTEFGSPPKIKRLGHPVSDVLIKAAQPLGYLRWISSSKQENLSLRFKNMSYAAVLVTVSGSIRIDIDKLLKEVRLRSHNNSSFNAGEIKNKIVHLLRNGHHDPWQVSRGHDLVHILAIGLREVFGNRYAKSVSYEQLDRILRISFGDAEFSETRLYKSILNWEEKHPDFIVLAHD